METESTGVLRRLGELLLAEGSITEAQLTAAIEEQGRTGQRLGEILLARRSVSRLSLGNAIAEQHADARRPAAVPASPPASTSAELDALREQRLSQIEAVVARVVGAVGDLSERLAALEALIPAITEALDCGPAGVEH